VEFLSDYGLFLAKTVTIVVAILIVATGLIALSMRSQEKHKDHIEIKYLNDRYDEIAETLKSAILSKKELKQLAKEHKKEQKSKAKQPPDPQRKRVFVLDFHGDIRASAVTSLREEITAILTVAEPDRDEVMIRLESSGGLVHSYGLAASQLQRLKAHQLPLTVAVDKVAASGGYMMACIGNTILAAPFAIVGSIGVLAQLPNFNRLLKKNDIDFEQFTAGEYKRTVTIFGETSDADRDKFQSDLEQTHDLFKTFVKQHRDSVDINAVATGEHWYGTQALQHKLVDALQTSDDYLLDASKNADLYTVTYGVKKPLLTRLFAMAQQAVEQRQRWANEPQQIL